MTLLLPLLILCAMVAGVYFAPMLQRARDVRRLQRFCARTRTLVLSFDDGPGPESTPALLQLLATHHARATFFPLGRRAECAPELLDQIAASGHEVGTHTHDHRHAWKVSPWAAAADVTRGYRTLDRWLPARPLFRPPYGKTTLATTMRVSRHGGRIGWWTIDSGDTRPEPPHIDRLVETVKSRSGGVVLLHDFDCSTKCQNHLLAATDALLRMAEEEGLGVMTLGAVLDEMRQSARQPAPVLETTGVEPNQSVSIVIVNWNRSDLLEACLGSIYARPQAKAWEVIVVDNASTDDSVTLIRERFPQVNLIANAENRGFAAANNQGIRVSTGGHVLLLNSDTEILGSAIEESIAYMERRRTVGVMGVRTLNPDRTVQLTCFRFPSLINMTLLMLGAHRLPWPRFLGRDRMRHWRRDDERDIDVVSGCYFLVRRAAFESVGLLDEQFFFYDEETDWCERARNGGWAVRFAPVGEIIHHGGGSSVLLPDRGGSHFARSRLRLHRKHRGRASATAALGLLLCGSLLRVTVFSLWSLAPGRKEMRSKARRFARTARSLLHAYPADPAARVPRLSALEPLSERRAA